MIPTASGGWWLLLAAGVCEVCWATAIPRTQGFTRLWPSVYCGLLIVLSLYLLSLATRSLPVGTAYAVWVGVGAVGTALYGMLWLGEAASTPRLVCLVLIVAGVAGLKWFGADAGAH